MPRRTSRRQGRRYVTGDDDNYGNYAATEPPVNIPLRPVVTFFGALAFLLLIMRSDRYNVREHTMDNMPDPHAETKTILDSIVHYGETEAPFQPTTVKYGFPVEPNQFTLPAPLVTNQTTVVLVLSARKNFERRAAIRETWAKTNDNVYFVIGGPDPKDKEDMDKTNPLSPTALLLKEQELYGDLIDSIHPDSYRSLPYKLHFGMKWVVENVKHVNWIAKCDDDHILRVKLLQFFVLRKFNPNHPTVVGSIVVNAPPHRTGKWAEDPKFTADHYPPWAFGSAGYVVSRPVAQYIASKEDLYYYQGEDAGLGIWLEESPLQVTFIDTPEVNKDKWCEGKYYIIGHDMSIEEMKQCWNVVGDDIPDRKFIVAFGAGRKDQHPQKITGW